MIKHIKDLEQILKKYNIPRDNFCIVGGGTLATKNIRPNRDIDLCIENKLKKKIKCTKGNYLSENVNFVQNKYERLIGVSDDSLINNESYHYKHNGFKIIKLELEFAAKVNRGWEKDEKDIELLQVYISQKNNEWDWDLFRQALLYGFSNKNKSEYRSKNKIVSLIKKGIRNPKKAIRYIYYKTSSRFPNIFNIFIRPTKRLESQLIRKMPTAALFGNHFINGEFFRYDLLMRYLTIDFILNNDEAGPEQYKTMQKKRVESETLESFKKLIDSVKEKGFLNKNPIPISKDGHIVDGSHRLACALYFNIKEVPIEIKPTKEVYYGKQWFIDNGFCEETIQLLDKTKRYLFLQKGIYFPVIIWPPAKKYFNEIANKLRAQHKVVFEKEVTIKNDFNLFLRKVYETDDIDKWKIGLKNHIMKGFEPVICFMLLEIPHPNFRGKKRTKSYLSDIAAKLKKQIRSEYKNKIDNYFYDTIMHIGDNFEHNHKIINIIRSQIDLNVSDLKENR